MQTKDLLRIYNYIAKILIGDKIYNLSPRGKAILRNFLRLTRGRDEEYYRLYTAYNIHVRGQYNLECSPSTIYSEKSLDSFLSNDASIYYARKVLYDNNIDISQKFESLSILFCKDIRKKYFNTLRGFLLCQSYGNLYDEEICKKCKYINQCKKANLSL